MVAGRDPARRIKGALLIIGILVLGSVLTLFAVRKQQDLPDQVEMSPEEKSATILLGGIHHTDIRNGVKDWLLEARSAVYQLERNRATLSVLDATFFNKKGNAVHLSAETGLWMMNSNDLEVSGNVMLKNGQYEMQTQTLKFIRDERVFVTHSPVTIHGAAIDQTASGMKYNLDSERIDFEGGVEGAFENEITQ